MARGELTQSAEILFHEPAEQTPVPGGTRGTRNRRGTAEANRPESRASIGFRCSARQWNKVEQPLCSAVPPPYKGWNARNAERNTEQIAPSWRTDWRC